MERCCEVSSTTSYGDLVGRVEQRGRFDDPPDGAHPLTEVAADTIIGIVVEQQNAGQYTVGSMATRPEVVSVTGNEVLLRDCTVETSTTHDAATGAVVEDGPGPPRTREVEVVNQDGTWRVSEIRTLDDPCTP